MSKPTTGTYSMKDYRCQKCGHVEKHGTNHWGRIYLCNAGRKCQSCGEPLIMDCVEPCPETHQLSEPWQATTLGELLEPAKKARPKKELRYPASVTITEEVNGKPMVVRIITQVYYTGMYVAVYINGELAHQGGDHQHARWVKGYLKDIENAKKRGAKIELGAEMNLTAELKRVVI